MTSGGLVWPCGCPVRLLRAHAGLVRSTRSTRPTPAQERGWPAIASGAHTLIQAPTGSGKTLAAFLFGLDRLDAEPGRGHPAALRVAAEGAQLRRRAQPARPAGRAREPAAGRRPHRRHAAARAAADAAPPARHPHHDARSRSSCMLTSQARETLKGVRTLIVDEVHAVAGTKRGAHLALTVERLEQLADEPVQRIGLSATQRPLEEIGRFVAGDRPIELVDAGRAKELDLQVVVPVEDMRELPSTALALVPGAGRRPGDGRGHRAQQPVDLAVDLPGAAEARPRAPLDDRVRQQPAARGAARAAPERARRGGDRARPPRLARARAARRDRGAAEARRDPVPRRHLVARARHRHGRGRPRRPGRVAEVGRARPAADRPRRPRARRRLARADLPEVPRRPARVRGRRAAHARRRDRGDAASRATRSTCSRSRSSRSAPTSEWHVDDLHDARPPRLPVLATSRARSSRTCSTCSPAATRPTSSPSCGRASSGTAPAGVIRGRSGRAAAGGHERRHDPRPRPVRRVPRRRRRPRRRARRGDGLRGARGQTFVLGASTWRIEEITRDRVLVSPGARACRARSRSGRARASAARSSSARRSARSRASWSR